MKLFERRIIMTTLDPIPRTFRACLGHLALNDRELRSIRRNDPEDYETIKEIAEIVEAEDAAEARNVFKFKPRNVTAKTPKISPSNRMAMLAVLNPGRST